MQHVPTPVRARPYLLARAAARIPLPHVAAVAAAGRRARRVTGTTRRTALRLLRACVYRTLLLRARRRQCSLSVISQPHAAHAISRTAGMDRFDFDFVVWM